MNALTVLTRPELDELTRLVEHADTKAHLVLRNAPLGSYEALADACGVAQDCTGLLMDCYDASLLLSAAEMDRVFGLGSDRG